MATFPYPYMNGRLHLGHAYSLTKAVRDADVYYLLRITTCIDINLSCIQW